MKLCIPTMREDLTEEKLQHMFELTEEEMEIIKEQID